MAFFNVVGANVQPELVPVPLPPELASGVVKLPQRPQQPPTAGDVVRAAEYVKKVQKAYDAKMRGANVSDIELAEAYRYQLDILQHYEDTDTVPAWFQDAVQGALVPVTRRLDLLEARQQEMTRMWAQVLAAQTVLHNRQVARGTPLKEVVFPDATWPTLVPHRLPRLRFADDIDALSEIETERYFRDYLPGDAFPATRDEKLARIREAIGCSEKHYRPEGGETVTVYGEVV
ncbi:hypothetical protein EXIGLDRAFT_768056 [Exidia glandulosa HHB12029]|uniref:Mug135-like C-terminal domain-containing protein n=1 Tax=Exidia glandulosa HHB12029 TaxID=1314781 RepID=A0A165IHG3_EXIGL|nr:hypothetical protein EXIGLDRAFT_768056 [Exidia glandulosa HHB12029]